MKLSEIGEFGFIDRAKNIFNDFAEIGHLGIGDDCAVIEYSDSENWLITTDMLIEDVHFIKDRITPFNLGYKSVAVNLSDIAAMGGTPIGTFLSIAIPPDYDVKYLDNFLEGYHNISKKYNTPLLGGDTTKSKKHLAINVTVIGKCIKEKVRLRSMAKTGDAICVTGFLGDSSCGLNFILDSKYSLIENEYFVSKHNKPEPRLEEGKFLASFNSVNAMMDISDGIASDLNHILKASNVSANIDLDNIPLSERLINSCTNSNWNAIELATGGGEDYELLFTVNNEELESIKDKYQKQFGTPITKIGNIIEGNSKIHWFSNNKKTTHISKGFSHF